MIPSRMTRRRALLEISGSIALGLLAGAVITLTWHGVAESLRIAHALLLYCFEQR